MIETHLISYYGSVANGGLLANFTPGGDGLKGKEYLTEGSLNRMIEGGRKGGYASKPTLEVHKLGGVAQGRRNAESGHLDRLAELNAKTWEFLNPEGDFITFRNLSRFCKDNGLSAKGMRLVLSGKQSNHKGYRRHGN